MPSPLWLLAHRVLASQFHLDPSAFLRTLDGPRAPEFLRWAWQQVATGQADVIAGPPLTYDIERPRPDLSLIAFRFHGVSRTGEPHHGRFVVRSPGPGWPTGYAHAYYLEHSEQLAPSGGALVCESMPGGVHRNLATILPAWDEEGFDRVVVDDVTKTENARAAMKMPSHPPPHGSGVCLEEPWRATKPQTAGTADDPGPARLLAAIDFVNDGPKEPGVYRGDGFVVERRPDGSTSISYDRTPERPTTGRPHGSPPWAGGPANPPAAPIPILVPVASNQVTTRQATVLSVVVTILMVIGAILWARR